MDQFNAKKFIIKIVVSIVTIALVILIFFQSKEYLEGPIIEIANPINGSSLSDPLLHIEGVAKRVSFITLNDRQIFIDENGKISEKLLLQYGNNVISLKAIDRFQRKVEKRLEIFYQ
ncbi:MAG: hypothetical protein AAB513_02880 [Patescibacteria group bacterium]